MENEIDTAKRERAWYQAYRALRVAGHPQSASKGVIRLDQTSHLSILLASLLLDDFTEEIAGATLL